MHYLITGASGFIGRTLCQRLVEQGHEVSAVSRSGTDVAVAQNILVNDLLDAGRLALCMQGVDVVVHLAARAHVHGDDEAVDAVAEFRRANVTLTETVATCARDAGVKRVVLISSIGVNGNATSGSPFTESDLPCPVENYTRSKLEAEGVLRRVLNNSRTVYVVLRPPLVYGPGCKGSFLKLLQLVKAAPILPFGTFRKLRSFIYVENLVDAIMLASTTQSVEGRVLLVSDGEDISLAQLMRELARAMGRSERVIVGFPSSWLIMLARLVGKQHLLDKMTGELQVDSSQFVRLTGWIPRYSLEQGLQITAEWYCARHT